MMEKSTIIQEQQREAAIGCKQLLLQGMGSALRSLPGEHDRTAMSLEAGGIRIPARIVTLSTVREGRLSSLSRVEPRNISSL